LTITAVHICLIRIMFSAADVNST